LRDAALLIDNSIAHPLHQPDRTGAPDVTPVQGSASMIRKSGDRSSEKIMLKQKDGARG
jgi:hypothetical protein